MPNDLYDQVVAITEEYLGPAAPRFMARQIAFHFHKSPQELAPDDLPKLIEWTKVTLGLLTENRQVIEDCTRKMSRLAETEAVS